MKVGRRVVRLQTVYVSCAETEPVVDTTVYRAVTDVGDSSSALFVEIYNTSAR